MSKDKKTFITDSANIPSMQKTGDTSSIKKSATIPTMGQAPGSTTTSQGTGSGDSGNGGKSDK